MSLRMRIPARCDYTRPMSRSVWSLELCTAVLIICILTGPVCAEGVWGSIYPFNVSGFSLAPGGQSSIGSDMPERAEAALGVRQSQAGSGRTADIGADVGRTPFLAKSPTTDLSRQLWQARISTTGDRKPSKSKNELQRIISEVGSVDFKPRKQAPEPLIVIEPIRKADPNETAPDKEIPQEDESVTIKPKPAYGQVTDETLKVLKNLSQQPEKLGNPLELGEILFRSHCLKEAAKCYREAISRMTEGESEHDRDMAWVLFQTGNCLRRDDPAAAMQMYGQLIANYPDSPWASLAEAKNALVGWYVKDTPNKLIDESKQPTL